jgi:hypothetical protein
MSMFTQKHYEAIAKVLADTYPEANREAYTGRLHQHERVTDALAKLFAADNERFDDQKFYRWAEPSPFTVEAVILVDPAD